MSHIWKDWDMARGDLGLDIVVPYDVDVGKGVRLHADFLVRNFGGCNGTLVFRESTAVWPYREELSRLGYGFSVLEPPCDDADESSYDREDFVEMLSEWSWTGAPDQKPDWLQ